MGEPLDQEAALKFAATVLRTEATALTDDDPDGWAPHLLLAARYLDKIQEGKDE